MCIQTPVHYDCYTAGYFSTTWSPYTVLQSAAPRISWDRSGGYLSLICMFINLILLWIISQNFHKLDRTLWTSWYLFRNLCVLSLSYSLWEKISIVLFTLVLLSFDAGHEGQLFNPLAHSYYCRVLPILGDMRYFKGCKMLLMNIRINYLLYSI